MANKHSTLTELFADIAAAIREKTGSAEEIVADNFPEAIDTIETGGNGIDTSDATATAGDMAQGVTAYVNGVKVEGKVPVSNSGAVHRYANASPAVTKDMSQVPTAITTTFEYPEDTLVRAGHKRMHSTPVAEFGDATAEDVVAGKTFTSTAGLKAVGTHVCDGGVDTSDATATADDIAEGATAYVDGEKVTGTVKAVASGDSVGWTGMVPSTNENGLIGFSKEITESKYPGIMWKNGAKVAMRANPETFGDATAEDVAAGKTFTSAAGLLVVGTMEAGGGSGGGLNITADEDGNVIIASTGAVTITDDGVGNVTIG